MYNFFKKALTTIIISSFFFVAVPPKAQAIDLAAIGGAGAGALVGCLNVAGAIAGLGKKAAKKAASALESNVGTNDSKQDESNTRVSCVNSIAVTIAKVTLAQLTESIVNWINTGFNGNPFYIRNRESYFDSIYNESLNGLKNGVLKGLEENPNMSPYIKGALKGLVNDRKATLASYGVNYKYTGPDPKTFTKDFKEGGGWAAWKSTTLSKANNPLAVNIKLGEESQRLIEKKITAVHDELAEPNFLSQKKCVDPAGYAEAVKTDTKLVCNRWEVTTPGSVIQAQINQALGTTGRQLELTQDLNQAVSKIFSALLDQFLKKGLSALSHKKSDDTFVSGGEGLNKSVSGITEFRNGDATDWLKLQPGKPIDPRVFDHEILPDIIITQLSYVGDQKTLDRFKTNNKRDVNGDLVTPSALAAPSIAKRIKLLNTANPGSGDVNNNSNLNVYTNLLAGFTSDWCGGPLHDLSYCIPGPRPGFEDNNIDGIIERRVSNAHTYLLEIDNVDRRNAIQSALRGSFHDAFDIYAKFIQEAYVTNAVLPVTKAANSELQKWPQYEQQISDNNAEETDVMSLTYQVYSVQVKMDDLMNRIYKRLSDEAKARNRPGAPIPFGSIDAMPLDPACLGEVMPFGGVWGTSNTNANGTTIGGTNPSNNTANTFTGAVTGTATTGGFSGGFIGTSASGSTTGTATGGQAGGGSGGQGGN